MSIRRSGWHRRVAIEDVVNRQQIACVHADVVAQAAMEADGFRGSEAFLQESGVVRRDRTEVTRYPAIERQRFLTVGIENLLLLGDQVSPKRP